MPARRAAGRPTPVLGHLQRLAELLLGKQFMRLDLLEGACAGDRDAQRGGADRAGEVGGGDPVVGPEQPGGLRPGAGPDSWVPGTQGLTIDATLVPPAIYTG